MPGYVAMRAGSHEQKINTQALKNTILFEYFFPDSINLFDMQVTFPILYNKVTSAANRGVPEIIVAQVSSLLAPVVPSNTCVVLLKSIFVPKIMHIENIAPMMHEIIHNLRFVTLYADFSKMKTAITIITEKMLLFTGEFGP